MKSICGLPTFILSSVLPPLLVSSLTACTPHVVRPDDPAGNGGSLEQERNRLEKLSEAGRLSREEVRNGKLQYSQLVDQLRTLQDPANPVIALALARAEVTLELYQSLSPLVEKKPANADEELERSVKMARFTTDYLRKLAELERSVEVLPTAPAAKVGLDEDMVAELALPPPTAARLVSAWRAGRYEQVIREAEGAGAEAIQRMEPDAVAAYALSLGAEGRFEQAVKIASQWKTYQIVTKEALELQYLQALWMVKIGQKDAAVKHLQGLEQQLQADSLSIRAYDVRVAITREEVQKSHAKLVEGLVDVRLALERGNFDLARIECDRLLQKEKSREGIDRLEGLLQQIDVAEDRAFTRRLDEVMGMLSMPEGTEAAEEALTILANQFTTDQYAARINDARQAVEKGKVRGEPNRSTEPSSGAASDVNEKDPAPTNNKTNLSSTIPAPDPAIGPNETGRNGGSPPNSAPQSAPNKTGPAPTAVAKTVPAGPEVEKRPTTPTPTAAKSTEALLAKSSETSVKVGTNGASAPAAPPAAVPADPVAAARNLIMAGQYLPALKTLESAKATHPTPEILELEQKAVDGHVQQVRERVARDYVKTQQLPSSTQKLGQLGQMYETLREALASYPSTIHRAKAEHNLKVIEQEILKQDAGFFETHPRFGTAEN